MAGPVRGSLIADDPIGNADSDLLDRSVFATRAARVIEHLRPDVDTAAMAVIGPWGSGKTSVLNLIARAVEDDAPGWQVVRFNPWLVNDLNSLVREFFDVLAAKLPP